GAEALGRARVADGVVRVLGRATGDDGHAARRLPHDGLDDLVALVVADRQRFTGAAERDEPVDSLGDLKLDQAAERGGVDSQTVLGERRHRDRVRAPELSHGALPVGAFYTS